MNKLFPKLSFVLGGAASGKSAFAENLVRSSGYDKTYIATAQAFDDEMQEKVLAHKTARGTDWHLIEAPLDVATAIRDTSAQQIILVDCLTLWLSNLMLANAPLDQIGDDLLDAIQTCPAHIVLVSNEVGQGVVPDTKIGREFRNIQGRLNQQMATAADLTVFVTAGLPTVLKGEMP